MDRRWLPCDSSSIAASTTLYRLLQARARPFKWETAFGSNSKDLFPAIKLETSCQYNSLTGKYQIEVTIVNYKPAVCNQQVNDSNGGQFIDFWEIDTDYNQHTFYSKLQILRRDRKRFDNDLCLQAGFIVEKLPACIAVKVYDVYGRSLTKGLTINNQS
jgi:hypothetical protein